MVKFSESFQIAPGEYFDVDIVGDTEAYVDPDKLIAASSDLFDGTAAKHSVGTFMSTVLSSYKVSDTKSVEQLLSVPHEINATHLGLSAHESRGNGTSFPMLDQYLRRALAQSTQGSVLRENPKVLVVLVNRFDKDHFSDLITNLILPQLCDFTLGVCQSYGIHAVTSFPIDYFDPASKCWLKKNVLLPFDSKHEPVILIPKKMLVKNYDFSISDYVWKFLLEIRQSEIKDSTGKFISKKQLFADEVRPYGQNASKQYALNDLQKNVVHLEEYLAIKKRNSTSQASSNSL
ncbi:hypothetical protein [Schleiferilactobacillus harbinensis]|uniref:hypothetical protein n=1 Tax=Schleiferilactobacillus harbinensis TaxID=304207 RepID=UPI00345E577A